MKSTFLHIIILALLAVSYSAQTKKSDKRDSIQPIVYIEILRIGTGKPIYVGDSKERVWLKLVNNTKWSIFVSISTDEITGERYTRHAVEKIDKSKYSKTEKPSGYDTSPPGSPPSKLKAGGSVIFSVPKNHLADNLRIRINFSFEWEYIEGKSDPAYSYMLSNVYLSSDDLYRFINKK